MIKGATYLEPTGDPAKDQESIQFWIDKVLGTQNDPWWALSPPLMAVKPDINGYDPKPPTICQFDQANLVTSLCENFIHMPMYDLDEDVEAIGATKQTLTYRGVVVKPTIYLPGPPSTLSEIIFIRSTTNWHLYLPTIRMQWRHYHRTQRMINLPWATNAENLQAGTLRLPWIGKGDLAAVWPAPKPPEPESTPWDELGWDE